MHSLKDTQSGLCSFPFIVPVVKNDLKLCVNHRFIAPSLYSQINPADLYDRCIYTKDKMYNAF